MRPQTLEDLFLPPKPKAGYRGKGRGGQPGAAVQTRGSDEQPPRPRRSRRKPDEMMTFSEAFETIFAEWFSGGTWDVWRIVGKAIFGEPLTPDELAGFQKYT